MQRIYKGKILAAWLLGAVPWSLGSPSAGLGSNLCPSFVPELLALNTSCHNMAGDRGMLDSAGYTEEPLGKRGEHYNCKI